MKFKFRRGKSSKAKKSSSIPSPSKDKEKSLDGSDIPDGESGSKSMQVVVPDIRLRSTKSSSSEAFFESKPWLDSDCEDDFFSVNGDSTPSRAATPNNQIITPTPSSQVLKPPTLEKVLKTDPSPTERKQRLADLLQEKQDGEEESESKQNNSTSLTNSVRKPENGNVASNQLLKVSDATPRLSRNHSSSSLAATPSEEITEGKDRSKQCCMPHFVHSISYREKRKQKTSTTSVKLEAELVA